MNSAYHVCLYSIFEYRAKSLKKNSQSFALEY